MNKENLFLYSLSNILRSLKCKSSIIFLTFFYSLISVYPHTIAYVRGDAKVSFVVEGIGWLVVFVTMTYIIQIIINGYNSYMRYMNATGKNISFYRYVKRPKQESMKGFKKRTGLG